MQFSDIPGLETLKNQLVNAFQKGKVAHAQLFSGRPHTAVMPMALAYATYILCENRTKEDSCGTCANCTRIQKLVHPDIHLHFPKIAASDAGKLDKVLAEAIPKFREFVTQNPFGDMEDWAAAYGQENKNLLISKEDSRHMLRNVSMRSVEGGFKIMIIWCPEKMNGSSANAILKILEEPPEKAIYLLISYQYDSLLATITSRTQLVSVPPNQLDEIEQYLIKKGTPAEKVKQAASLAEGKIGAAEVILREGATEEYKDFQAWMLACWNKNLTELSKRSEDFHKAGKAFQRNYLLFAISMIRNAVLIEGGQTPPIQDQEELNFIGKFSAKLGLEQLEKCYQLFSECSANLERNANARISHLNLSLDLISLLTKTT